MGLDVNNLSFLNITAGNNGAQNASFGKPQRTVSPAENNDLLSRLAKIDGGNSNVFGTAKTGAASSPVEGISKLDKIDGSLVSPKNDGNGFYYGNGIAGAKLDLRG